MEFPTITCKNSVSWMPVHIWSSAHRYTVILQCSFNSFTDYLSTYISSLKSFRSLLKYSKAQLLKISMISVLPPSHNDLQQNNEGILKSTPKHFTKATMGDWCFMVAAWRLCNSLPISIRSACTKRDFKQKLKTFLFSKAFC